MRSADGPALEDAVALGFLARGVLVVLDVDLLFGWIGSLDLLGFLRGMNVSRYFGSDVS